MARRSARARPDRERVLWPVRRHCPACGARLRQRYDNGRTVATLTGLARLRLKIFRCENVTCPRHHQPYRPEGPFDFAQDEGRNRAAAA
jgi:hypothetical protein